MTSEYDNYSTLHDEYKKIENKSLEEKIFIIKKHFGHILNKNKNLKILDIGCGEGALAKVCSQTDSVDYYGIDICSGFIEQNKKLYPNYTFKNIDIFDFFSTNNNNFDIIFMSHVFEHFDLKKGKELLQQIHSNLNKNGYLLNIMPNASSIFLACELRYKDITHKTLYSENSFNQLLNYAGFNNMIYMNKYIGQTKTKRLIHKITKFIFQIFIKSLGFSFPKIYTNEIITIAKK